jgi:hypothetical protein
VEEEEGILREEFHPSEVVDYESNPISSRWMLGKIIVIVSGLLMLLQIILFFSSRWTRMESENLMGDTVVKISLNPLLVWLPVWNGFLAGIWWWNCRKEAGKRDLLALVIWLLTASLFVGIAVSMSPPSSYVIQRSGPRDAPYYFRNY